MRTLEVGGSTPSVDRSLRRKCEVDRFGEKPDRPLFFVERRRGDKCGSQTLPLFCKGAPHSGTWAKEASTKGGGIRTQPAAGFALRKAISNSPPPRLQSVMVAKALRPAVVRSPVSGSCEGSEDKAGRNQRHRMSLDSRREKQSRFSSRAERRARLTHPTASSGGDEHRDQRVGDCENVDQHDPEYGLYDAAHLTAIGVTVDRGTPAHNREEHDQRSETLKERLE
jgi:hypothetical protein